MDTATRRERLRAATIEEIKATALALMREQGTTQVRFADIAREMGLTAPALYRYFADRDELLTAMIVDAYDDLAGQLASARESVPEEDVGGRLLATAAAYRRWAANDQQRFALVFGMPVPGYAAPTDSPTTEAANRAMANLAGLATEAIVRGVASPPLVQSVGGALADAAKAEQCSSDFPLPAATYQALLHAWAALHGFTCLEAYGHLDWLPVEARDALFVGQVRLAALAMGVPAPHA